jgi:hypothetical protein
MPQCGFGIFFELKNPILFNNFGGVCSILDRDVVVVQATNHR